MHVSFEFTPEFLSSLREAFRTEAQVLADQISSRDDEKLMTIDEVADFMQVSIGTVRSFMRSGLPFFQEGQVIRFIRSEVIGWVKKGRK